MKYYTQNNPPETIGEINTLPSMTIPDESYTVQELLQRSLAGTLPHDIDNGEIYTGEEENIDFVDELFQQYDYNDPIDRLHILDSINDKLSTIRMRDGKASAKIFDERTAEAGSEHGDVEENRERSLRSEPIDETERNAS